MAARRGAEGPHPSPTSEDPANRPIRLVGAGFKSLFHKLESYWGPVPPDSRFHGNDGIWRPYYVLTGGMTSQIVAPCTARLLRGDF